MAAIKKYKDMMNQEWDPVEAMRLTSENFEEVRAWCHGQVVWTSDPIDPKKDLEVGINFRDYLGVERLNQGEWLIKVSSDAFERTSDEYFSETFTEI